MRMQRDILSAYLSRYVDPKSLDATEQVKIDALWVDEVEKRVQAIDQGNVTLIPGEQVLA